MNGQGVHLLPDVETILSTALVLQMANPTERFFRVLQDAKSEIPDDDAPTAGACQAL